jgi:hypothetical protein
LQKYVEDELSEALIQGEIERRKSMVEVFCENDKLAFRSIENRPLEIEDVFSESVRFIFEAGRIKKANQGKRRNESFSIKDKTSAKTGFGVSLFLFSAFICIIRKFVGQKRAGQGNLKNFRRIKVRVYFQRKAPL